MTIFKEINKFQNNNAIITETNETINYKAISSTIDKICKKINSRSLVFLVCGNNPESILGYISFLKADCAIVLLEEKINYKSLKNLVDIYKPNYLFLKKNFLKLQGYDQVLTFKDFDLIKRKNFFKINLYRELSLLISTSGSTGSSKLVRISKKNLEENTRSIINFLKITSKDTCITTLPMSYVYGLSVINTHLKQGCTIVLNEQSVLEKKFWSKLLNNKVTTFSGVPYTYQMLDKIDFYKKDLKYIRYLTQAGGKLNLQINKKIAENFYNNNKDFIVMYGAAEATARMSYLPSEFSCKKIGSIGVPIPGGKFWIEDNNQKKIEKENEIGELYYSGKNVCLGYAENINDLSKGDENKGILKTGDIAKKDKDNFYYILGRNDRFVKIFGNRINLDELENSISKLGVQSLCKVNEENRITIFVKQLKEVENIKKNIKNLTDLHPSVFDFKTLSEFPLNKNFKTAYNNESLN